MRVASRFSKAVTKSSARILCSSCESVFVSFLNVSIIFFSSCLRFSGDNVLFKFLSSINERLLGVCL